MTSYIKKRNCCFLQKSKTFLKKIINNANAIITTIENLTIKGEFCELQRGDFCRLYGMRSATRMVIVSWAKYTQEKLNSEVILYTGYDHILQCNPNIALNGLRFTVRLYTYGKKLEACRVPMYTLSDKVNNSFALDDFDKFYTEYKNNPETLTHDISEFILSIKKLEYFIEKLIVDDCCNSESESYHMCDNYHN